MAQQGALWRITFPTLPPQVAPPLPETTAGLAAYAKPETYVAIVDFSPKITLAQLLRFYNYDFPKPSRVFDIKPGQPRLCSGNYGACGMSTKHHRMPGFGKTEYDYHDPKVEEKRRGPCCWQGCMFTVPDSIVGDEIDRALRAHKALVHYKHILTCPLCRLALDISKGQEFLAYDVITKHLLTGLCTGLARHAICTGRPVTRPHLHANSGVTTT